MMNSFWWGRGRNNKGVRWPAWDKLSCTKKEMGIGFKDLKSFNMAMVAKQGRHLMKNPDKLVAREFKARYYPNSSFLKASQGHNSSFAWRSLCKTRVVLNLGCRWSIGDGSKIKVMYELWL